MRGRSTTDLKRLAARAMGGGGAQACMGGATRHPGGTWYGRGLTRLASERLARPMGRATGAVVLAPAGRRPNPGSVCSVSSK